MNCLDNTFLFVFQAFNHMVTGIKTAVLKFDHIEIKDGGVYICKAVNEEGEDSRQIIVSVVGMM